MQYQRFLTALSGRPGSRRLISLHLFPSSFCADFRMASSSAVHEPCGRGEERRGVCTVQFSGEPRVCNNVFGVPCTLFTVGSKWFTYRSRHCLALRPGM